jgi:hypothetical protein
MKTKIGQDELMEAVDSFGLRTVLEMLAQVCLTKAQSIKNSVGPGAPALVKSLEQQAARVEKLAEHINDAE